MPVNPFLRTAQTGDNDLWRYLLTVVLVVFLFLSGQGTTEVVSVLITGVFHLTVLPPQAFLTFSLFPFILVIAGLTFSLPLIHHRSLITLLTPYPHLSWRRFLISAGLWLLVSCAADLVLALVQPGNYQFRFNLLEFLPWLIASLLLLPIQCAAEELFFRGYLTQAFGLANGYWAAWLFPSIFFGLLHGANPEVKTYGVALILPLYIGMGLLLGWLTLRTHSMEIALGLHVANNLYSALLVTFPSSVLPAPALFNIQTYDVSAIFFSFILSAAAYLILLRVIGHDYFRAA